MTTIKIELPDGTAQAARDAGLLIPQALDRLLIEALTRKDAADAFLSVADPTRGRVASARIARCARFLRHAGHAAIAAFEFRSAGEPSSGVAAPLCG